MLVWYSNIMFDIGDVISVPAALPLLLSALGFFGFIGWRRMHAVAV
jgi:hypothetical protein